MFEMPTIAHLAATIRQLQDASPAGETMRQTQVNGAPPVVPLSQTLVPIRPRGSLTPLFCVHPASGVIFPYYGVANYFEPDRPLYAIQDPAVEADRTPRDHVEEMAADYVEAIKEVQPHGPYHVIGWSFGGYLAYEMARQLTLQGETVGLVGVIDTPAPNPGALRAMPLSLAARQFLHQARMLLVMTVSSIPHIINGLYLLVAGAFRRRRPGTASPSIWVRLRWLWLQVWRRQLLKQAGLAKYVDAHADLLMIDLPALQRVLWLLGHHTKVDARYVPVPYAGSVTLFRAELSLGYDQAEDPTDGWARLALKGVEVCRVPGNHAAVLAEPFVQDFTRTLVGELHKIESERRRRIMKHLLRLALRSLRLRLARTLLTTGAVTLGVAVILATGITILSTEAAILRLFNDASGRADLIVLSANTTRPGFSQQVLRRIDSVTQRGCGGSFDSGADAAGGYRSRR